MTKKVSLIIICFLCSLSQIRAQTYLWPTDASPYMAGSFAEFRPGHFHSGIDIKTWVQEGYKVFAVSSGYIWKVRISPFGYGRVIYQRLDDGNIAVYAHLQRFSKRIEAPMTQLQESKQKFSVTKTFKENAIRVKKGEVIAFTGRTGIGVPHLHFEIRNSRNWPVNPLNNGVEIKDTIPPIAKKISIKPLDGYSEVDGDTRQKLYSLKSKKRGHYSLKDTVQVYGTIGMAVDCYDMSNDVSNKYSVYGMTLSIDDSVIFDTQYDWFSFSNTNEIEIDRDYRLWRRGEGRLQKAYKEPYNTLPFYKGAGDGIIRIYREDSFLKKGLHDFELKLFDIYYNTTVIQGVFRVEKKWHLNVEIENNEQHNYILLVSSENSQNILEQVVFSKKSDNRWEEVNYKITADTLQKNDNRKRYSIPGEVNTVLKITARDADARSSYPVYLMFPQTDTTQTQSPFTITPTFYDNYIHFEINTLLPDFPLLYIGDEKLDVRQINQTSYTAAYPLDGNSKNCELTIVSKHSLQVLQRIPIDFSTITPERGGRVISEDGYFKAVFGRNSVYSTLFARVDTAMIDSTADYEFIGKTYNAEPFDIPLHKEIRIHLKIPEHVENQNEVGLFYWDTREEEWSFVEEGKRDSTTDIISGNVNSLEKFTLIRDGTPPVIEKIIPDSTGYAKTKRPKIEVYIKDELSGIENEESILIELDGKKLIAEYDPEDDVMFYQVKFLLEPGKHKIYVRGEDQLGNVVEKHHFFYVLK